MVDQMRPVRIVTEATWEIEMLSSLEPMSRGLMRDTRCGVTSILSGNQRFPAVQRLALKTNFSSDMMQRLHHWTIHALCWKWIHHTQLGKTAPD
jgi:hypothetical protein